MIIVDIEIEPGVTIGRHTHPGIESAYILEGGDKKTRVVSTYVVEKGKPLASPA